MTTDDMKHKLEFLFAGFKVQDQELQTLLCAAENQCQAALSRGVYAGATMETHVKPVTSRQAL